MYAQKVVNRGFPLNGCFRDRLLTDTDQKLQMDGGKVILNQEREDTFFQRDFPWDTGT